MSKRDEAKRETVYLCRGCVGRISALDGVCPNCGVRPPHVIVSVPVGGGFPVERVADALRRAPWHDRIETKAGTVRVDAFGGTVVGRVETGGRCGC